MFDSVQQLLIIPLYWLVQNGFTAHAAATSRAACLKAQPPALKVEQMTIVPKNHVSISHTPKKKCCSWWYLPFIYFISSLKMAIYSGFTHEKLCFSIVAPNLPRSSPVAPATRVRQRLPFAQSQGGPGAVGQFHGASFPWYVAGERPMDRFFATNNWGIWGRYYTYIISCVIYHVRYFIQLGF